MAEQIRPHALSRWNHLRRPFGMAAIALAGARLIGSALVAHAQTQTPRATAAPAICGTPTAAGDPCVGIGMFDIYFDPNTATIPSEKAVEVALKNNGVTVHNFSVTDHGNPGLKNLNISVTLNAGESGTASINAPDGEYYFFCDQPGHEAAGMRGYITVKSDAAITTASATVTPRPE